MKSVTGLVFLMGCCAFAGCASQAPTAPAATAPSASGNDADQATATAAGSTEQKPIPYGYTRTVVNGVEKFCRVDSYTGSRTEKTRVCLTRLQLDDLQNTSTSFIQDVQRRGGTSSTNTTPGAGGAMGGAH